RSLSAEDVANPLTISPQAVARSEAFVVTRAGLKRPSKASEVRLIRGAEFAAKNITVWDSADSVRVSLSVPSDAKAGDYEVGVLVNDLPYKGRKRIRPPGSEQIHISEFDPDHIYDDGSTVTLRIRGQGLACPPEENSIWINGVRQSIKWDQTCPDL